MTLALVLFGIAAVGGVTLAALRLSNKSLPMPLALIHGLVAAIALVLLLVGVIGGSVGGGPLVALILFVVAALGGFFLFSFHLRKEALPIPVVAIHGLVAVVAFVILFVAVV